MTPSDRREGQPPLWFTLLFVGQVAGFLFVTGLEAAAASRGSTHGFFSSIILFTPATLVATALWGVVYLLYALLTAIRLANLWACMAAALIVFGAFYFLSIDIMLPREVESSRDLISEIVAQPIESLVFLVPLIAVPTGLLFHFLIWHVRLAQPFSSRDRFIALTWGASWLALGLVLDLMELENRLHIESSDWRREASRWAILAGFGALPAAGLAAGFVRLKSQRISLIVAGLGWTGIVALAAAYVTVLSRPRIIEYVVAGRTYDIPLRYEPRAEGNGFSFDTAGQGPFEGRDVGNQRLYVSNSHVPLRAGLANPAFVDPHRPAPAEIATSHEGEFEVERYTDKLNRPTRNYYISSSDGQTTTLIKCQIGYCFHCFLDDGLRYCLHGEPNAYVRWRDAQRSSAELLERFRRRD